MQETHRLCSDSNVLVHIHGVGGIGKSWLLKHWSMEFDNSVLIDCRVHGDFYSRLNQLAAKIRSLGVDLPRFDTLWDIKTRYIDRREPAAKDSKEWAVQAASMIPVVGSFVEQADKLRKIGSGLRDTIRPRTGSLGSWLEKHLGDDFKDKMVKSLFEDPEFAMSIFLKALEDDFNNRPKDKCRPAVIMLDRYEVVNREEQLWCIDETNMSEAELWQKFLSTLQDCIGVTAGRESFSDEWCTLIGVEQRRIHEFDVDGCAELLERKQVKDLDLQRAIIDLSQRHPFLLDLMCAAANRKGFSKGSIGGLESKSLDEIRVKTWNTLFDRAASLSKAIEVVALLPFFNEDILEVVYPDMKSADWFAMINLSFVTPLDDEVWEMHDLARRLAISELGRKKSSLVAAARENLMKVAVSEDSPLLHGLAISVEAILDESDAMRWLYEDTRELIRGAVTSEQYNRILEILRGVEFESAKGKALHDALAGQVMYWLQKPNEAEALLKSAYSIHRGLSEPDATKTRLYYAMNNDALGCLYTDTYRPKEAEERFQQALQLLWELEAEEPGAFTLEIATTLNRLALLCSDMNKPSKALAAYKNALRLYRALAEKDPDRFLTDVGKVQNNLGLLYHENAAPEEAEEAYNEALNVYTSLAQEKPELYLCDVAMVLDNLGIFYSETLRPDQAEEALRRSLKIYKQLAQKEPELHKSDVAMAYFSLGGLYMDFSDCDTAEMNYRQALQIYRELAEGESEMNQEHLADTMLNLGMICEQSFRPEESERFYLESMAIYEKLMESAHDMYVDELALALSNAGDLYLRVWRTEEAEASYQKSMEIYRALAADAPTQHGPNLARVKRDLAELYVETNRFRQAEELLDQAKEEYQEAYERAPDTYGTDLATTLRYQGDLNLELRKWGEAERLYEEALKILRRNAGKAPAVERPNLAECIDRMAILHLEMGELEKAEAEFREALETYEEMPPESREWFTCDIALIHRRMGNVHSKRARYVEAEEKQNESLRMLEDLAKRAPNMFNDELAESLSDLGNLMNRTGRYEEAEAHLKRAVDLYADIRMRKSGLFKWPMAETVARTASMYYHTGRMSEAETSYFEALTAYNDLAKAAPDAYGKELKELRQEVHKFLTQGLRLPPDEATKRISSIR
jgi:tetratricopeptide (TPR) repeat protein